MIQETVMSKIMIKFSNGDRSKRFTPEQKLEAVLLNISGSKTMEEISKDMDVSVRSLVNWKNEFFEKAKDIFEEKDRSEKHTEEKTVERLNKEIQLLKKLLNHYKITRSKQSGKPPES